MIINRQPTVRIPLRPLNNFLLRVLRALRLPSDSLAVCLVTNAQMARWNRAYRGKKSPTDVLSFPAHTPVNAQVRKRKHSAKRTAVENGVSFTSFTPPASSPSRGTGAEAQASRKSKAGEEHFSSSSFASSAASASYLGDIAIAPAVARQNARRFGRTFDDELRILVLHGILHLMGYDHETDTGQMQRREQRLRRTLGLA